MTQGSKMQTQENTSATVPMPQFTPNLRAKWRESKFHTPTQHAIYVLSKVIYAELRTTGQPINTSDRDFVKRALTKAIRAFSPKRQAARPWRALHSALDTIKHTKRAELMSLDLTEEEFNTLKIVANELLLEFRFRDSVYLMELAAPQPPPREKKPYVRPA